MLENPVAGCAERIIKTGETSVQQGGSHFEKKAGILVKQSVCVQHLNGVTAGPAGQGEGFDTKAVTEKVVRIGRFDHGPF